MNWVLGKVSKYLPVSPYINAPTSVQAPRIDPSHLGRNYMAIEDDLINNWVRDNIHQEHVHRERGYQKAWLMLKHSEKKGYHEGKDLGQVPTGRVPFDRNLVYYTKTKTTTK